jgi:hypothetical protein
MDEKNGDRLASLVFSRTGLKPTELQCPREKSDMTPCVARDGSTAVTNDGRCVGCSTPVDHLLNVELEQKIKTLEEELAKLREAAEKVSGTYYTSGVNTMYGLNELRKAMEGLKQVLQQSPPPQERKQAETQGEQQS